MINKLKSDLQKAVKLVQKYGGDRIHIKIAENGNGSELEDGSLSAVQICIYTAKKLIVGGYSVQRAINKAKQAVKWPESVKSEGHVLFMEDDATVEEFEIEPNDGYFEDLGEMIDEFIGDLEDEHGS